MKTGTRIFIEAATLFKSSKHNKSGLLTTITSGIIIANDLKIPRRKRGECARYFGSMRNRYEKDP